MNSKEKKVLNLRMLTKRVERNLIDRRSFIKGAVALGVTASTAMLLYQAYDHTVRMGWEQPLPRSRI